MKADLTTNVDRCFCNALSAHPGEFPLCLRCDEPICPACLADSDYCDGCSVRKAEQAAETSLYDSGHESEAQRELRALTASGGRQR